MYAYFDCVIGNLLFLLFEIGVDDQVHPINYKSE